MIISDHKFQEFINNIPFEKKVFLLHGTLNSKIWYFRKLLENKLVGPRALEQMKLVFIDRSLIHKDKNILLNEIKTRSFFGDKKVIVVNDVTDKDSTFIKEILENFDTEDHYLILTGGYLNQNSKIRKLVEKPRFLTHSGAFLVDRKISGFATFAPPQDFWSSWNLVGF